MDFDAFKIKYADTMLCYQRIEYDIKYIYAYMKRGNINEHFIEIENKTLGQMIRELKKLDFSDDNRLISAEDYNFLTQICDNRNHWAHKVFTEFIYTKNWINSKKYQKQCDKLEKDYDRVNSAAQILENIRFNYCAISKR